MRFALLTLLLFLPTGTGDDVLVIRAERIITVSGEEILGGTLLIEDGRIKKIGKDIAAPEGAREIRATVVMPGLVDAGSSLGIRGRHNEDASEVTPAFRVMEAIDPTSSALRRAVRNGVTTMYVGPGNRNVIGGLGTVIRTSGDTNASLVLKEDICLKAAMGSQPSSGNYPPRGSSASFYSRRPTTRMGVVWVFRKAFFDAQKYKADKAVDRNAGQDILVQAMEKKIPVRFWASLATDIETAIRLSDEFGLSPVIEEAEEAHKLVSLLKERKVPVILRPRFNTSRLTGSEGSEIRFDTFARLTEAGLKVALLPTSLDPRESLLNMAAFAVRCGADRGAAIRAVTLTPAEILGVNQRVGSLEEGRDANLLLLTGDPLDVKSRIEAVYLEGKRIDGNAEK